MDTKLSQKASIRHERIVEIATKLFLQNGYEKTSLSDVVAISGGSMASLYKFFGNKEGLFTAVVKRKVEEFYLSLEQNEKLKKATSLEQFLFEFGMIFIELSSNKDLNAFWRLTISQSYNIEGLVKLFSQKINDRRTNIIGTFLQKQVGEGRLKDYDVIDMGSYFQSLIMEPWATSALLSGVMPEFSQEKKQQIVKRAVDIFLNGVCNS